MDVHKPNNKLVSARLKHFWCTNKPHAYTDSQDSPWLEVGEATTFPIIVFSMPDHGGCTQMSFCPRTPKLEVPKFLKLGFPQLWKPITIFVDL